MIKIIKVKYNGNNNDNNKNNDNKNIQWPFIKNVNKKWMNK